MGDGDGPVPVLDGSQPGMRPCRRFRWKRKVLQQKVRSVCDLGEEPSSETSLATVKLEPLVDRVQGLQQTFCMHSLADASDEGALMASG